MKNPVAVGVDVESDIRSLFLRHAEEHCRHLDLPVSADAAWPRIEAVLFG
ncbi:hypothetical protein HY633_03855 [Candidatus Uhrbacteria bacterium]|nr:hypothetical protein [Candidatus Uhrbacteria bacterium]